MAVFSPLLDVLADVPDPRRAQGQIYKLPHVLLFSILAIVTGCNSYRGIVTFMTVHRHRLNATFGLNWRRAPAHTAIRYILQGLDPAVVEGGGVSPNRRKFRHSPTSALRWPSSSLDCNDQSNQKPLKRSDANSVYRVVCWMFRWPR